MTALVTGSSGFIGTRLVRRLSQQGETVIALDIAPPRERLDGVRYVETDVGQPIDVTLGEGVDTLYNFAATHRTPGHPPEEYYATNVSGALNVTKLAEQASIKRILFTSSISVYGPSEAWVSEASPLQPVSDYGRSKSMAEVIHRQWAGRGEDRRLVVVRPGVVFGPGERGNYTFLANALRRRMFVYPGRKDAIKSGGYVDELLDTFAFALARSEPELTYNFAFPTPSTTEDIVETFHEVAGFPHPMGTAPLPLLLTAALGFEALGAVGLKTPIHRDRVRKLVNSTAVTPQWLLDSGYTFTRNLKIALTEWKAETGAKFV
jgi:nucleoside-diphosphate-sugar epimerase